MRDDDVTFVELVHRELRTVRWPEPAELRALGSRRNRRAAVAAAAVVLAAICGSTVALAGAARQPAVTVAASPSGAGEIPVEALLSRSDPELRALDPTADMELGDSGLEEPVRVDGLLDTCAREHGEPVRTLVSRYSRSRNLLGHRLPDQPNSVYPVLVQDIYRMTPDGAAQIFADLDRHTTVCAAWEQAVPKMVKGEVAGTRQLLQRWQVVDRDFAGDRAVLLRHTESEGTSSQIVRPDQQLDVRMVVQVGDLVTVLAPEIGGIVYPTGVVPRTTDEQLRTLARGAATRMCLAANPRC
ncbi:hypothetical protein B0E53_02723 [Micromonospora sp. MH33]|uniref:hypothetical protein n=1 Tax=Micromonospora sp. MH33 TaxID=1945509 RepID=UPI000D149313|nr:hypothetical protein [Micromonospora sp. MH33]PSK65352.1 hypothetical protein B0E53_02723 [Micromonospora sp. MH33]